MGSPRRTAQTLALVCLLAACTAGDDDDAGLAAVAPPDAAPSSSPLPPPAADGSHGDTQPWQASILNKLVAQERLDAAKARLHDGYSYIKALQARPEVQQKLHQHFGEHWREASYAIMGLLGVVASLIALWLCCICLRLLRILWRFLTCYYCRNKRRAVAEGGYGKVSLADGAGGEDGVEMVGGPVSAADGVGSDEFFGLDDDGDALNDFDEDEFEMQMEYGETQLDDVDLDLEDDAFENV